MSETPALQETQKFSFQFEVEAWPTINFRKEARVAHVKQGETQPDATYELACDEGPWLAGDNTAPPPLAYFASGVAF